MTREERVGVANQVIKIMASHGRRFFSQDSDRDKMESPRISQFELAANKRLWFVDKYTEKRIFVHFEPAWRSRWKGFSNGGTMRSLIEALRDYILREDVRFLRHFGPWPDYICRGDLWGYGEEAMVTVRQEVNDLMKQANVDVTTARD